MTHEEARDAMALFVVDADDAATRSALEGHVAECGACGAELAELRQAVDALGQAVPQILPRSELKARIMAAVTGAPAGATADVRRSPRAAEVANLDRPARRVAEPRTAWAGWLAAAAALIAAVSLGGWWQTRGELAALRTTLASWEERVRDAEQRVLDAERRASSSQATLVAYQRQLDVMTADDLQLVSLGGVPPASAAQGKAFVSRSRSAILFTARGLPALPQGRTYQLWAIAGGQPISAGTFAPDAQGRTQLVADVPALTVRPAALAVTVEPAGGVPAPTGAKVLIGMASE